MFSGHGEHSLGMETGVLESDRDKTFQWHAVGEFIRVPRDPEAVVLVAKIVGLIVSVSRV